MNQTSHSNPFNDYVFLDASPADRGSFTLATEKALAKLEKFQLPDPSYFIVQWLQALIASGAGRIDITYSTNSLSGEFRLKVQFDGPGYSRTEVDALYDHVFLSGRDRSVDRLRELALGWLSACSLPLRTMVLSSNGRRRTRTPQTSSSQERTEPCPTTGQSAAPPHHFLELCGEGHYCFEEILTRQCGETPAAVYFNTNLLSQSSGSSGVPWPNRPFVNGPSKGVMGATYGASATSHISFIRYGVEFVSRSEPLLQPPIILRVSDPTLSKNVSQTDVVRDDAYEEFLARIRTEMKTMGLQLTSKRIPGYQREALNRFLQTYLMSYIDIRVFEDPERLAMMGPEFHNLTRFPLFRMAGGSFASLADLRREYREKGYLLYSLDGRSRMTRWRGVLLVIEAEELVVLKKFFSNLHDLTWREVLVLCQGGLKEKLSDAKRRPIVCQVSHELSASRSLTHSVLVKVPDVYPTGKTVTVRRGGISGTTVPGVHATLIIESESISSTLDSSNELANLTRSLKEPVQKLIKQLAHRLSHPEISKNQSRARYAELCCELLGYLLERAKRGEAETDLLTQLGQTVLTSPILGLEDGSLVSIADLRTYIQYAGSVFLGGAFVEGLESGALDPMPAAQKLLDHLLHPSQVIKTDSVRDRIANDPELRFGLRRQTIMKGLSAVPNPQHAFDYFATEAAAQERELLRLEREYKEALAGSKLFVQPDEERLQALAEALESQTDDDIPPPVREAEGAQGADPATPSAEPTQNHDPLPSLDSDLRDLRRALGDFCSTPGAVHIERREDTFHIRLSSTWNSTSSHRVYVLLAGREATCLTPKIPLEGFIRVGPTHTQDPRELLDETIEPLVLKALHTHSQVPYKHHQRQRLRNWLLECCELLPQWKETNRVIASELFDQPLVPCLGNRSLSWRQLLAQAKALGQTLVSEDNSQKPNPEYDILAFQAPWRDSILQHFDFPPQTIVPAVDSPLDFEVLIKSTWRDIYHVVQGAELELLRPEIIAKITQDSSFWTRWRAGFLSWDASSKRVLVNPEHKLGKALLERFQSDPGWSSVFASALFSTINRGLEAVEDSHERAFLQGLLDLTE